MLDRFEELIQHLAHVLQMPLHVDHNHGCAIQIQEGLIIQFHPDPDMERLLISCQICEVPPGKFRENVLKEALKANGKPDPILAIFSYIVYLNILFAFQRYPLDLLNGEKMAALIAPFFDLVKSWKNAIQQGHAAPPDLAPKSGPFPGLRP